MKHSSFMHSFICSIEFSEELKTVWFALRTIIASLFLQLQSYWMLEPDAWRFLVITLMRLIVL